EHQATRVAGHLQVAAADDPAAGIEQLRQALPVDGTGAGAVVKLLGVGHGADGKAPRRRVELPLDRIGGAGARADPDAAGPPADLVRVEDPGWGVGATGAP